MDTRKRPYVLASDPRTKRRPDPNRAPVRRMSDEERREQDRLTPRHRPTVTRTPGRVPFDRWPAGE